MTPYRHLVRVPFHDVDSMRVVWHGHYVNYFEQARCGFFRHHGLSYLDMESAGFMLPVVSLQVKYVHPCLFDQEIAIDVEWDETNTNLLVLNYRVSDAASGKTLCKATTRHAAIDARTREVLFELPPEFVRRLLAPVPRHDADTPGARTPQ